MRTIRIKAHIDSEIIHISELKDMIGKDVEIIVIEHDESIPVPLPFNMNPTRVPKPFDFEKNLGGWPGDVNDGFEDALREWRTNDKPRDLPE